MYCTSKSPLDATLFEVALAPIVPSSSTPIYISLKRVQALGVLIIVRNATTVTGSAITLLQATAVAGTAAKALPFTTYYTRINATTATAWTKATATSDTFTTSTTDSVNHLYFIPIDPASLDTNAGFDCIRLGTANAVAATVAAVYQIVPKDGGNPTLAPSYLID